MAGTGAVAVCLRQGQFNFSISLAVYFRTCRRMRGKSFCGVPVLITEMELAFVSCTTLLDWLA